MSAPPIHTNPALIGKVAQGDAAAFRELFHAHWDRIFSVAMVFTKSQELSEELVQDVFLKIWMHRLELPAEQSSGMD